MQDFFFIRIGKRHFKIMFPEILCVEGYENYVKLYTEGKLHMIIITMKEMEKHLPAGLFCRVHKSWIVSISHIHSFDELFVELKGMTVPVGKNYKDALLKKVNVVNKLNKTKRKIAMVA